MRRLDAAVAQLFDGPLPRRRLEESPAADADVEGLPRVIALGPPRPPAISMVCGRLPQQLADLRLQLRQLGAYCDSLQATAASAREHGGPAEAAASLESLELAHATAMGQARELLGGLNARSAGFCEPQAGQCMTTDVGGGASSSGQWSAPK
mmetsp:Transcript_81467/g.247164  ORF Transcript_81467/g.247164 Transcript_81467/m.247164 type:complete len:152 (-) Transcript_81467:22-477(-)